MEIAFKVEQKAFLTTFKGLQIAKNCLRSESAPLKKRSLVTCSFLLLHLKTRFSSLPVDV